MHKIYTNLQSYSGLYVQSGDITCQKILILIITEFFSKKMQNP